MQAFEKSLHGERKMVLYDRAFRKKTTMVVTVEPNEPKLMLISKTSLIKCRKEIISFFSAQSFYAYCISEALI